MDFEDKLKQFPLREPTDRLDARIRELGRGAEQIDASVKIKRRRIGALVAGLSFAAAIGFVVGIAVGRAGAAKDTPVASPGDRSAVELPPERTVEIVLVPQKVARTFDFTRQVSFFPGEIEIILEGSEDKNAEETNDEL